MKLELQDTIDVVRLYILGPYARMASREDGSLCIHRLLRQASIIENDGVAVRFQLPLGNVNVEELETLLERMMVHSPSACSTRNIRGELPWQAARSLGFGDPVVAFLRQRISSSLVKSANLHIVDSYAAILCHRHGTMCIHWLLHNAGFQEVNKGQVLIKVTIGSLSLDRFQVILERMMVHCPLAVQTLDREGRLPFEVAYRLQCPELVLNVLLREYPDALLMIAHV